MLNIKAEYENNMKLKEDIEINGFTSIDKSKYRVFVITDKSDATDESDATNKDIITGNDGLPRALKTIAWGEWFYGIYRDLPKDEKTEKIEQVMKEWKKKVYDDNKGEDKGKWTSSNEKDSRLDAILEEKSYYRLLCDAVALGRDGLGTGRIEIPKIMVPMKIMDACVKNKYNKEALLMAIYYHYAVKDEDGFVLIEKADFGKWSNGTTKYKEAVNKLGKEKITKLGKKKIIEIKENIAKVKITVEELKWNDNCDDETIEFTDNGERGMARQAESVIKMLNEINKEKTKKRWEKVPEEIKEEIARLDIEIALKEFNWDINSVLETDEEQSSDQEEQKKSSSRVWKITREQNEKRKELLRLAKDNGLTNTYKKSIFVLDE